MSALYRRFERVKKTDLVAIAPREGFCSDVHVGILDSFLQGRHVLPMFPMLIPQILRVDGPYDKGRYDDTVRCEPVSPSWRPRGVILDTEFTPKIWI